MENNWLEQGLGKHPYDPYLSKNSWKFESNQLERYETIDFHQESPRYGQLNWWPKPRGMGGPPEIQYPDELWALLPHNHPTKSSSHAQAIHPRSNAWRQHHRCGTTPRTSNRSWCRSPRGTHVGSSKKQHSIPQTCRVRMDINMQVCKGMDMDYKIGTILNPTCLAKGPQPKRGLWHQTTSRPAAVPRLLEWHQHLSVEPWDFMRPSQLLNHLWT